MNLQKRVEQLEERMTKDDDFLLFVISTLKCDPDKLGPERVIDQPVIGYSATGADDRVWMPKPGEALDDLKTRIKQEALADGRKVLAVCEVYDVKTRRAGLSA